MFTNVEYQRALMGLGVGGIAQHVRRDGTGGPINLVSNTLFADHYRIQLVTSGDEGTSWSQPVLVAPHAKAGDQTNPAVAVNADGLVGVVCNDFGDDPDNACCHVHFAVSADAGRTFGEPLRISQSATCPAAALNRNDPTANRENWLADGKMDRSSPAYRWINGGDTQGIAVLPDGSFSLAWPYGGGGVPRLCFTHITPGIETR